MDVASGSEKRSKRRSALETCTLFNGQQGATRLVAKRLLAV